MNASVRTAKARLSRLLDRVAVGEEIVITSAGQVALRSLDAIHLASAERCQSWPLCSNDVRMRAAAVRLGLPLAAVPE